MIVYLSFIFFLSGAAALLFETIWFRQAGLMFGNSVWASSLVMASFMGGLAFGNALTARYGGRIRLLLPTYALIEAAIGIAGFGLVLLFPVLTPVMAPLFRGFLSQPEVLNLVRLGLAFLLMVTPATAMGATLPVLVRAMSDGGQDFGRAFGRLYGWNTLGAAAGAVAGEWFLIERLGIRGTGLTAAALYCIAALAAVALWRRGGLGAGREDDAGDGAQNGRPGGRRLLAAAFVCGATFLALEVVWFRFLLLFVFGSSLTFATMLSVVLLGIAAGALVASAWLKRQPDAHRFLPLIALATGLATSQAYVAFSQFLPRQGRVFLPDQASVLVAALRLMFPTALLSAVLFTFLGQALKERRAGAARTAGLLTLANTMGAMAGALVGGFVLLPQLGTEQSLFALSAAYGIVALLALSARRGGNEITRPEASALVLGAAVFVALLALFPFGLMRNHFLRIVAARWSGDGSRLVAVREGLTETILYLRKDLWEEPAYYRLQMNAISMSGTTYTGRRYMGLFAYLPLAVRPESKRALLISYGVGTTARALTDNASLESIDVVDISRDVLEMSRIVYPPPERHPLDDPRVRVHVEDGRFFLLTSDRSYDVITAEPPPPKYAGIVNLYSREYFRLLHDRLADGGVASYWLPTHHMAPSEAKAIIRGFCDAFDDCSLWTGFGPHWILLGTRHARGPIGEEDFTRQWRDPLVGPTLRAVGLEVPEQLGTLFIADAPALRELTQGIPPLDDDHPQRLSLRDGPEAGPVYWPFAEIRARQARFAQSELIRRLWPPSLRERSLAFFDQSEPLERFCWANFGVLRAGLPEVLATLRSSQLRVPVLWILGGDERMLGIARRAASRTATT
jgi:predicted membrane-bound spermidine synthase